MKKYLHTKYYTLLELCMEKLNLYRSLSAILYKEKDAIVKADIKRLWEFSAEKQHHIETILQIRQSIIELIAKGNDEHREMITSQPLSTAMMDFIREDYAGKKDLSAIISDIRIEKKKIRSTGAQNIAFIHDYLDSVDDMIGLITGQDKQAVYNGYGRADSNAAYTSQRLYSREV